MSQSVVPMTPVQKLEVHCCICGKWGPAPEKRHFGSRHPLFACEGPCLAEAERRVKFGIPMPDISKALMIEGWMSPDELYWLASHAADHEVIVEFGSYYGRSTRAMADHCPGTVYAVDNWNMLWEPNKTFSIFQENVKDAKAHVVAVHQNHAEIQQWIYKIPSMVFIDGDHRYDYARRDIEFWLTWMARPGLICGHDFGMDDVARAVRDFFPRVKECHGTSIWYVDV